MMYIDAGAAEEMEGELERLAARLKQAEVAANAAEEGDEAMVRCRCVLLSSLLYIPSVW